MKVRVTMKQQDERLAAIGQTLIFFGKPDTREVVMTTNHPDNEAARFKVGALYQLDFTEVSEEVIEYEG